MAEGITGWRLHVGVIFPTPVPPRAVLEFYEAVPEGVDMTTVSLTIQQLSDDDMDEAIKGMERAAKQLASFDVDLIYQSGVPPVVRRGLGFGDELADRLSQAAGLPHRHVERICRGAQDLPRIRDQARRHLHSVRRLGQHPQYRPLGKLPRFQRFQWIKGCESATNAVTRP